MSDDKKAYHEEDIGEEDRQVFRLYEETQTPIAWDDSDDAILAFSRQIKPKQPENLGVADGPLGRGSVDDLLQDDAPSHSDQASKTESQPSEDDNVVAFAPRKKTMTGRAMRSPLVGLAMAASLMLGLFLGEGFSPLGLPVEDAQDPVYRNIDPQLTTPVTPTSGEPSGLDRLAERIAALSCADVSLAVLPNKDLRLRGYVASADDLVTIRDGYEALPSQHRNVHSSIDVRPWPACETLGILGHFAPASGSAKTPIIRPLRHGISFAKGEPIVLEASAAALGGGYLYVDYLQSDGTVVHMLPTAITPNNQVGANGRVVIGEGARKYLAGEPFGDDLVIIVQSPVPLFDEVRPEIEPAQNYLPALRQALDKLNKAGHGDKIFAAHTLLQSKGP